MSVVQSCTFCCMPFESACTCLSPHSLELDAVEQPPCGLASLARRHALELAVVREHLDHLAATVEPALLGEVGDRIGAASESTGRPFSSTSPESGLQDVRDHPDHRGLARPVGAKQGEDLARGDLEADPVDYRAAVVDLGDLSNFEHEMRSSRGRTGRVGQGAGAHKRRWTRCRNPRRVARAGRARIP